jgi:hypothetical protein
MVGNVALNCRVPRDGKSSGLAKTKFREAGIRGRLGTVWLEVPFLFHGFLGVFCCYRNICTAAATSSMPV